MGENEGVLVIDPETGDKTYTLRADTEYRYPSDVLFVIDESISMDQILGDVQTGFTSLAAFQYPPNTRMAVTNTAPAQVSGSSVNFSTPFVSAKPFIAAQPGFLRLVSKAGLDSFRTNYASQSASLPVKGCTTSWFTPDARDQDGVPCLIGASQVALQTTGVEAGVVSLKQLILKANSQGAKLFRKDSNLTVIFVSDTHDPGNAYYGSAGAETSQPTYAQLKSLLYAHEPSLKGLKFNAIVPLPQAGNSMLAGVNVIGNLPLSPAEEKVSSEELWSWNYLKLVSASGGSAMHIAKNDWGQAIGEMVKGLGYLTVPTIKIGAVATEILEVKVNGVVLTSSQYILQADNQTIQIPRQSGWGRYLDIEVKFK